MATRSTAGEGSRGASGVGGAQPAPTNGGRELALVGEGETRLDRLSREAFLRSRGIDPTKPLQLEIWPQDMRAIPNDYARSAIFTVRNKKEPRVSLQGTLIFHVDKSVKVTFTGIELRADDDELVWQQIIDYAKHYTLGSPVEFNLHQLCKDLGWSINSRNYDRVRECITRLKANEIKVENERLGKGVGLSLIREYEYDDHGSRYRVWIHPNLIMLFAGKTYTQVEWRNYRDLKPIARRLYDYLASHRQPYPLLLETFHKMCGSTCGRTKKWSEMVREACAEIVDAGLVKKAWVNDARVFCER